MAASTHAGSGFTVTQTGGEWTKKEVAVPVMERKVKKTYFRYGPLDHAVAGLGAGFVTTMCLHPLDLVKTRFQVQDAVPSGRVKYRSTTHAISNIVRTEGVQGLYQGLTPNIMGNVVAWGSYFLGYNAVKTQLKHMTGQDHLGHHHHMLAACLAGVGTQILTNPLWVMKTRMCYQVQGTPGAYRNIVDAFVSISRSEGIAGLYKGLIPGLFGVSHGAVQFMVYEDFKRRYPPTDPSGKHSTLQYLAMAAVSKIIAAVATYPYQVLRSRLQNQRPGQELYSGVADCVKKVWRNEGFLGFYHGLGPNILRVTPATCITFVVYEQLSHTFTVLAEARQ